MSYVLPGSAPARQSTTRCLADEAELMEENAETQRRRPDGRSRMTFS